MIVAGLGITWQMIKQPSNEHEASKLLSLLANFTRVTLSKRFKSKLIWFLFHSTIFTGSFVVIFENVVHTGHGVTIIQRVRIITERGGRFDLSECVWRRIQTVQALFARIDR
jgi:hypothetical protein